MKLLIYTVYYPSPEEIGIPQDTKIVHYFAREWVKMGNDVRVVFMNFRFTKQVLNGLKYIIPREGDYVYEGIPVHYFDVQGFLPKRWYTSGGQATLINSRLNRYFAALNWKPDKVFIQFPTRFTGIAHPFSFRVPTLGVFHNTDRFCLLNNNNGQVKRYVSQFDHYGYYNHQIRAVLKKELGCDSIPAYAGIDGEFLAPPSLIEEKAAGQQPVMRLLYAGKFMKQKNVDTVIEAAKALSFPWELDIIGDGEEKDTLKALAAGHANIHFSGLLPREEVISRMRKSDVFVMVSHTETFGLVYLEAMAQGCITVGSRGEGIDGIIVDQKNGFLVRPGSVSELTQRLEAIHAMPQAEKAALIRSGFQLAQDTTNEKMARRELLENN